MAEIRRNGRGTLVIEKSFGGVKIRRASGTNDPQVFADVVRTLDSLARTGQRDYLRAVAAKRWTPLEVHQRLAAGLSLPLVSDPPRPLAPAPRLATVVDQMLAAPGDKYTPRYLRDLRSHLARLVNVRPDATATDLPELLLELRNGDGETKGLAERGARDTFRTLRQSAITLAKWLEKRHRLAGLVEQVRAVEQVAQGNKWREHRPYSVFEALAVAEALDGEAARFGYGPLGDLVWTLCITGMRPSEFWGGVWTVEADGIHIDGTKSDAARRRVPNIQSHYAYPAQKKYSSREGRPRHAREECPSRSYDAFTKFFYRVQRQSNAYAQSFGGVPRTVYDFRRTFAHWMEEAGITATHRRYYLGHEPPALHGHYERVQILPRDLVSDGDLLRRYIERRRDPATIEAELEAQRKRRTTLTDLRKRKKR